jgi:hypothetical protein
LPKLDSTPHQIAFFAAVTAGQKNLSWEIEYTNIHANLSNDFNLCSLRGHTNKNDLIDVIEDEEPHIIHFCGHGQEKEIDNEEHIIQEPGLIFFDETKRGEAVLSAIETGELFGDLKEIFPQLVVVVLSACHSDAHAQAISVHDIYTIGTSREIHSDIARRFSGGFYKTLSKTYDLKKAFEMGIIKAKSGRKGRNIDNLIKLFYQGKQIY